MSDVDFKSEEVRGGVVEDVPTETVENAVVEGRIGGVEEYMVG